MTAYYIDNTGLYADNGRYCPASNGTNILQWMLNDNPRESKLLYDLDPCATSLIKMVCNREQAQELFENERVIVGDYKITYFPAKFLGIDRVRGGRAFCNYGNMVKYKSDVHYSPNDTAEDKINKAKEAQAITNSVSGIFDSLNIERKYITSLGKAVREKYLKPLNIPTADDIPDEAGEIAFETIKSNWLEVYQLGSWGIDGDAPVYDYDINVAYGSRLAKLLDTRRGTWIQSVDIPDKAYYGFARGLLDISTNFHPFIVRVGDYSYTPAGARPDSLTLQQIRLLRKYNQGTFEIRNGWWWIPSETKPPFEILKGVITHLASIRSQSEGLKKVILRQMIARIWGLMTEDKGEEYGEYFNPVWASIVENDIKDIVWETCLINNITPIQVAVDGIITDKPLPIEDSKEMGKWRLSHKGKCIISASNMVAFEGKDGAEEFALHFDWLYNEIKNNPDAREYKMDKYSPITFAKAMQNNGKLFNQLGELDGKKRVVTIGRDYKRMWQTAPTCGGDLLKNKYQSRPIDIVMAKGIIE